MGSRELEPGQHPSDLHAVAEDIRLALVQYQSRFDSVATNARFRWGYLPGSELFLVYSDGRTTLSRGVPDVENRSFVVKVTRLLQF